MANQYFLALLSGRDLNIRASDEDRERIADRLRQGHAEGRLDLAEFQQRLEHCYAAKTLGELSELVGDLPRQQKQPERSPLDWLRAWHWGPASLLPLLLVLFAFAAASGHEHHFFWLWVPLAFVFWRMSWWRRRRSLAAARRDPGRWI
jgi:Domain of unknown function (DUF1707)